MILRKLAEIEDSSKEPRSPSPRPVSLETEMEPIPTDPSCSASPRPETPGKQLQCISPRQVTYSKTDIRYKLQKAGLYTTIKEQDP